MTAAPLADDRPLPALREPERPRRLPVREPEQNRDDARSREWCGEHREQRGHVHEHRCRLLRELAASGRVQGDTTTLEDYSILARLREDEE